MIKEQITQIFKSRLFMIALVFPMLAFLNISWIWMVYLIMGGNLAVVFGLILLVTQGLYMLLWFDKKDQK